MCGGWRLPAAAAVPLAGGGAGCAAWLLSYPLDCAKSNLQGRRLVAHTISAPHPANISTSRVLRGGSRAAAASVGAAAVPPAPPLGAAAAAAPSAWAVARHLVAARGWRGLYAGLAPSLARAFVVSSSRFSAYEAARWALTPE